MTFIQSPAMWHAAPKRLDLMGFYEYWNGGVGARLRGFQPARKRFREFEPASGSEWPGRRRDQPLAFEAGGPVDSDLAHAFTLCDLNELFTRRILDGDSFVRRVSLRLEAEEIVSLGAGS